jgi:hypothetical protein
MEPVLGVPITVENRAGANGILGMEVVAKAPADGYTLVMGGVGPVAINPALYPKLPFNIERDFTAIVQVADTTSVLVVPAALPVKTLKDLIALAKKRPGELFYSSSGSGSTPHLNAALLATMAGIDIRHVPYKGSTPGRTALLGGEVSLMVDGLLPSLPFIESGRFRALGITSAARSPAAPQVPTIAETTGKPALLIAFRGDVGRGSGRCNTGINLRDALAACREHLVAHGGHAAAAGLEVHRDRFEAFKARFQEACARLQPAHEPVAVDGAATFAELDPHTVRKLDQLGPFGNSAPRPRFCTAGVRAVGLPSADARGVDVRMRLVDGGVILPARVLRGQRRFEELCRDKGPWTAVYSPRIARSGEEGPVVLDVHELRPA